MTPVARRTVLVALAAAAGVSLAQAATTGSGTLATETRKVAGFSSIALRGSIDLVVRQGEREAVQVKADDNILPLVQTLVEGPGEARTLRIQLKAGESIRTRNRIEVTVELIKLNSIAASGSGDIAVGPLKTPSLSLSISGSSDAKFEQIEVGSFSISIAGSGDVAARGKADKLDIAIAGSGDVRTRELAADEVSVSIAGSGDASVTASKALSVSVAGSGDVDYGGAATLARSRMAGSGTIRQRP